jgi:hypothetical protein
LYPDLGVAEMGFLIEFTVIKPFPITPIDTLVIVNICVNALYEQVGDAAKIVPSPMHTTPTVRQVSTPDTSSTGNTI